MNNSFNHTSKTKKTVTTILKIIFFIGSLSMILSTTINDNNTIVQLASAQTSSTNGTTGNLDTFNAKGTISSLLDEPIVGKNVTLGDHPADIWVLGGNWSFGIMKGNLSDFNANIIMTQISGSGLHTHSIANLRNATGAVTPLSNTTTIMLRNSNYTDFMGIADINTNGQVEWKDVPMTIHLLNGNIASFNMDPTKTQDHFKGFPVFGTVISITDQNNKELRTGQPPIEPM